MIEYRMCKACGKPIFKKQYEQEFVKRTQFTKLPDIIWDSVSYHTNCRKVTLVCPSCLKPFKVFIYDAHNRTFCSRKCERMANAHKSTPPKIERIDETEITKNCIKCGEVFHRKRYADGKMVPFRDWNKQKFCSRKCYLESSSKRKNI